MTEPLLAHRYRHAGLLPANSPLRRRLAHTLVLAREQLRHPELLIYMGREWRPGRPLPAIAQEGWIQQPPGQGAYEAYYRPSAYRPEHRQVVAAVCAGLHEGERGSLLPALLDEGIEQACGQISDREGYFQDPAHSVPDLVATVAGKFAVDDDAAVLYLQLLALPDPSDASVARWTGWRPARLKAARAALAATDLVVGGKRARAGRSLFLPGGWRAYKSPFPPIEEWKAPLFELGEGKPVAAIVPLVSVEQLFRQAWQRVAAGDAPAFEELRT